MNELQPITEPGRKFVALMERHAAEFAPGAAELDREGRFAADNVRAMCESGALAASVPEELGGLGVSSYHDLGVGVCRLARGDASTAIASWMHLVATRMMAAPWRAFTERGKPEMAEPLARTLRGVVQDHDVIAVLGSEPGTYAFMPRTTAVMDGDGWTLNGTKIFATMSQAATLLNVGARTEGPDGKTYIGFALVPADAPGVQINDDWDALGMRASGSGSVKLENVRLPSTAFSPMGEMGVETAASIFNAIGRNVGLVSACIGIAEAATAEAAAIATTRRKAPNDRVAAQRFAIQREMGELAVTLNACRASFAHSARAIDDTHARLSPRRAELAEMRALDALVESTKITVERGCREVVDRALTISGGGGYMSKSPLSRHYRDVRALGFMFPQSTETLQTIGMVALGMEPELDL